MKRMSSLLQNTLNAIDAQCNECENIVTVEDVLNGINQIKSNKYDGCGWFLLYPCSSQTTGTSLSVIHGNGVSPDGFNIATIIIVLSSPLSKLFDWIIMMKSDENK